MHCFFVQRWPAEHAAGYAPPAETQSVLRNMAECLAWLSQSEEGRVRKRLAVPGHQAHVSRREGPDQLHPSERAGACSHALGRVVQGSCLATRCTFQPPDTGGQAACHHVAVHNQALQSAWAEAKDICAPLMWAVPALDMRQGLCLHSLCTAVSMLNILPCKRYAASPLAVLLAACMAGLLLRCLTVCSACCQYYRLPGLPMGAQDHVHSP